jgi:pyruvate dehydrogenase E2 component (dihydrolipoamide acetyltransferase)
VIETTTTTDYAMPSLGADMDEGAVVEWLVGVGDEVERGQVVARVETEKSDIDIEIWQAGVVDEIIVEPNRIVPVGTVLMRLRTPHAARIEPSASRSERTAAVAGFAPSTRASSEVGFSEMRSGTPGGVLASPRARRLAAERGIELSDLAGSGPGGAVRERDLDASVPPTDTDADTDTMTGDAPSRADRMRSVIAVRMARSNSEIPHYRLQRDVDLDALLRHLAAVNESRPITERVVPAAAFVRAVATAAARHPELNGTWTDGGFRPGSGVNVSVAISLRTGGLVTPTIPDADRLSLDELMQRIREYTTAARSGNLRSEWVRDDSTITVTNLGERGADLVHGLISPPEVALVGFGRVLERPWVVSGTIVPRSIVTVTLGADHRATDGAVGSRFLSTLARSLEEPDQS